MVTWLGGARIRFTQEPIPVSKPLRLLNVEEARLLEQPPPLTDRTIAHVGRVAQQLDRLQMRVHERILVSHRIDHE